MALSRSTFGHAAGILLLLITFFSLIDSTSAVDTKVVQTTNNAGEVINLADDRKPALYTQNFGDCLGSSLINVTRFDAAYYQDNMTVLFHLEGNTAITNESLMSMCKPLSSSLRQTDNPSVHWCLCLWFITIQPQLQPVQCANLQVGNGTLHPDSRP